MMEQPPNLFEFIDLLDSEALTDEGIELSNEQIDRAIQLSQPIPQPNQQWQIYLHGLALVGFEQWLDEWAPDLTVDASSCSIGQPPYANLIDAICHLQVGRLDLCLIATPVIMSSTINLPKAVVDLPQFVPDVYVLVEVQEEHMQVQLYGYLRRDQLIAHRNASPLAADSTWVYTIPLCWFNDDASNLLIELRQLDSKFLSASAPLPLLHVQQSLQTHLHTLLPQLRSPDSSLSQLLGWDEAATLLANPALVNWIYEVQTAAANGQETARGQDVWIDPTKPHTQNLSPSPTKDSTSQLINVRHWLNDRLDAAARTLGWMLLPSFSPASALRSAQEELKGLGVQLPPEARGAYEDVQLGNVALRLHAFVWMLSTTMDTLQWTLLIVLGAQPQARLPTGIRLQVSDQSQLLFDQALDESAEDSYLYAQVGGEISDRFWVTIALPDGATLSLPPFIFYPDSEDGEMRR